MHTEQLRLPCGTATWERNHMVRAGDRLIPARIDVVAPGGKHAPEPALTFTIEVADGVPVVTRVELTKRDGHPGVRADSLRRLRLNDWVEDIVAAASLAVTVVDGNLVADRATNPESVRRARSAVRAMQARGRRKVTPDHLATVAEVYIANEDNKPAEAVALAFGASDRTAFRWIAAAKREGLI